MGGGESGVRGGNGGRRKKKKLHFENVQDLMQLPRSHFPSLLSAGAKSHISTASGCVDSFTNRNVKRHTQGGLRDKGGRAVLLAAVGGGGGGCTGQETEQTGPRDAERAALKTPRLGYFNYGGYIVATSGVGRAERKRGCSMPLGVPMARCLSRADVEV